MGTIKGASEALIQIIQTALAAGQPVHFYATGGVITSVSITNVP